MRWTGLLLLAAIPATNSHAAAQDWNMIWTDKDANAFIDMANVTAQGSSRIFWHKIIFADPAANGGWKTVMSRLQLDCSANTVLGLSTSIYDSDGRLAKEVTMSPGDKPDVIDGSNAAQVTMRKLLC